MNSTWSYCLETAKLGFDPDIWPLTLTFLHGHHFCHWLLPLKISWWYGDGNIVKRCDRRTDRPTDGRTDSRTDRSVLRAAKTIQAIRAHTLFWKKICIFQIQISLFFKQILCIESPKPTPQSVFITKSLLSRHLYNSRCFTELLVRITFSIYLSVEVPAAKKHVQGDFRLGNINHCAAKPEWIRKDVHQFCYPNSSFLSPRWRHTTEKHIHGFCS